MTRTLTAENIDDLIDAWHNGAGEGLSLHEYLGLSWPEYARWVETNELPEEKED